MRRVTQGILAADPRRVGGEPSRIVPATRRPAHKKSSHQHSAGARKKAGEGRAIERSRGGLSTKIHALVDALGNPIGFFLTGGEAHDLEGADYLLPTMPADTLIADKAFNPDARVTEPLAAAYKDRRDPAANQPVLTARL
jgi:hypothetical protein